MAGLSISKDYLRRPRETLQQLSALTELSDDSLDLVTEHARWLPLEAGDSLARHAQDEETYWFVHQGHLSLIVRPHAQHQEDQIGGKWHNDLEHLAFFGPGDLISDGYARRDQGKTMLDASSLDCIAVVDTLLVGLKTPHLDKLMKREPSWAETLEQSNQQLRAAYRDNKLPALRVAQDFFLRQGYSFASSLKVIQLDRCINCDACEDACADRHGEARLSRIGPVLGALSFPVACRSCVDHRCVGACGFGAIRVDGSEVLIDSRACVGCTACKDACPNGVIEMVDTPFTVEDFPNPLPQTDAEGETNVPGLHLVGEATGDALIKLAINSGKRAAQKVIESLDGPGAGGNVFDVIVAGAGPAGLSAALTCMEHGLSYAIFDKGHFATTIMAYPKKKVVMAEPAHVPLYGSLWLRNTTKEELIEHWQRIIDETSLPIRSYEGITGVEESGDVFTVTTEKGRYRARRVILAIGVRGSPRKLGAEGETRERVHYVLTDPEAFEGKRLLVVGGGDSAVEAAMSLADVPGTTVALSYRRDEFGRIKAGNRARLDEYEQEGRIEVILRSTVSRLTEGIAELDVGGEPITLPNDVVFAMLGAEPPTKFFESCGIEILTPGSNGMRQLAQSRGERSFANKCDHCHDYDNQACIDACPTEAIFEVTPEELFVAVDAPPRARVIEQTPFTEGLRRSSGIGAVLVTSVLAATIGLGIECVLRLTWPEMSLLAWWQRSRGIVAPIELASGKGLGHDLGYLGTMLMLIASLYPMRSRLGWFQRFGSKSLWLTAHILGGVVGPAFVTYHTLLHLHRWPSIAFWAMWLVVITGALGRYLKAWLQRDLGVIELERASLEQARKRLFDRWEGQRGRTAMFGAERVWSEVTRQRLGLLTTPFVLLWHQISTSLRLIWMRRVSFRHITDPLLKHQTLDVFRERARAARRALLREQAEASVGLWRRIHLWTTLGMFVVTALHVAVALLYGVPG